MEGKVSTGGAQKVFDQMPGSPSDVVQQEEVPNCILRVAIHEVIYPMTEEVLHLVFDPYGGEKGVLMMVLEKIDHVLVFVAFPSPHEATRAREALHGRNIYDGCCQMDIKYSTPPLVRNTTVTALTPTSTQPVPCSGPTLKAVNLSESAITAVVSVHAGPLHHSVALAAAATSPKLPATDEPLGANQVLDRMPVATDDKELVQVVVKKEQLSVPGVFDRTHERITSEMKLCRFVKWVSRVCITRRRVRWTLRSKYRNLTTTPSPPPAPPHPPDQPVHSLDPCSAPQAPAPPRTPDPLSGIGPLPWPSFQYANISEGSSKHMLAVKPPEGRDSVGPEDLIVPVGRIEHECISAPVHIALWCLCHEQILRSASTHGLYTPAALKIIHRVTQSTTRPWNPGIVHTIIHCSLELFALRAPLMYGLRVELEGLQAMLVSLVELKLGPSWKRTRQVLQLLQCFGDFTSFGQYSVQPTQNNSISLFIISASFICLGWSFMLWDSGNQLRFLHLISSDNQFLSLEKFKGSVASISIYIEWASQEMVLFCWKSQLSIARDMCPLQHLASKFQYRPWNPGVHKKLIREAVQPAVVQQRGELKIIDCISRAHAVCTGALYWDRMGGYHRTTILAGNTHWGGLLVQNFGENNVLELDHEQNTDVLGVIPGILLLLQRYETMEAQELTAKYYSVQSAILAARKGSSVLAIDLFVQGDPRIMKILLMEAMSSSGSTLFCGANSSIASYIIKKMTEVCTRQSLIQLCTHSNPGGSRSTGWVLDKLFDLNVSTFSTRKWCSGIPNFALILMSYIMGGTHGVIQLVELGKMVLNRKNTTWEYSAPPFCYSGKSMEIRLQLLALMMVFPNAIEHKVQQWLHLLISENLSVLASLTSKFWQPKWLSEHNCVIMSSNQLLHAFCSNFYHLVEKRFSEGVGTVTHLLTELNGCREATRWKIIGDQVKLSVAHEFSKTGVQLTFSDVPPFLPLFTEYWYRTMIEIRRKKMGSAAKFCYLVQSDDTYQDNHSIMNSIYPSCELTISIIVGFHRLAQEDKAEPPCYCEQVSSYGQVEFVLALKVTHTPWETCYSRIWLSSIITSVHPYMTTVGTGLGISLAIYLQYRQWDPGIMKLVLMHPTRSCLSGLRRLRRSW